MINKPGKGQVQVRHYKTLQPETSDMKQWPNGQELLEALSKERVQLKQKGDADFWQALFRWSLLKKYGLCPENLKDPYYNVEPPPAVPLAKRQKTTTSEEENQCHDDNNNPHKTIQFTSEDIETVTKLWEEQCELISSSSSSNDDGDDENDLQQFLKSATSNGRQLQWSFLDCGPACQFKLHAHPNLEVIYCVSGALHEIRMEGTPITKRFEQGDHPKGPDLTHLGRPWKFDTLLEGDLLVNEVGSIHRSFCATNGDGCLLFVLWGGSHADVAPGEEPKSVSIQGAMDTMDQRLCDCGSNWETLSETFLPESEKSK